MSPTREAAPRPRPLAGVLVVDKPRGPTSHDVVARVRRLFATREVGHAGTLDPMATGVLVVAVGEATKLVPFLTADDKTYEARLVFGRATDTLDEEGSVTAESPVPAELLRALALLRGPCDGASTPADSPLLARALAEEQERTEQVPPAFSAIRTDGERAHERARRGERVELPPRPVQVRSLRVVAAGLVPDPWLDLHLEVAKGYYVRSLARDLADRLGTVAHLSRLRRVSSGRYTLEDAAPDVFARDQVRAEAGAAAAPAGFVPLGRAAARCLPSATLSLEGERKARFGQLVPAPEIERKQPLDGQPLEPGAYALFTASGEDREGALVAVAAIDAQGDARVIRGFSA